MGHCGIDRAPLSLPGRRIEAKHQIVISRSQAWQDGHADEGPCLACRTAERIRGEEALKRGDPVGVLRGLHGRLGAEQAPAQLEVVAASGGEESIVADTDESRRQHVL